ncbi:MAG: hypothetical protein LM632_00925 [Armatimonadetes bacterium]|nr:hypothetical protein [Armatimonadota bacterium]
MPVSGAMTGAFVDTKPSTQVRARSIVIALSLVIAFTIFSSWAALLRHEILGTGYLPRGIVPLFLIIVLLNASVRKTLPFLSLTRSELLFVFAILSSIAAVSGQEFGIHFYLNLLGLVYYSSPQSQWFNLFTPHIPPWLVPSLQFRDPAILWAYEGMPEGATMPLLAWFKPLCFWTPYIFCVYAATTFLCSLIAKQWEENERLLYPLTQIPSQLTQENLSLFQIPSFWLGFLVAAIPYSLRGLHLYFPQIPDPQLQRDAGQLFASGPLTVFNNMELHFYPEMVGIAYLLSNEVGLSLWFFPILRRIEIALRVALGYDMLHSEFVTYQTVGAYIVMAINLFWTARFHLTRIAKDAFFLRNQSSELKEREGWILVGLIVTFVCLLLWSKLAAKASLLWTLVMLLCFLVASLVIARIVAETGIYIYSTPFRVNQILFDIFGKDRIGAKNIVMLTAMSWVQIRSTATMVSGYLVNALRLNSLAGLGRKQSVLWLMVATLFSIFTCHIAIPTIIYSYSVPKLSWWAQVSSLNTANLLGENLTTSRPLTLHHWIGLIVGAITCWLLIKLRLTFAGFPLHPLGFITWTGWPINTYWLSIVLGWVWKLAVLHYGGYHAFNKAKPFAYGLVVGGTSALTFWIILRLFYPTAESVIID